VPRRTRAGRLLPMAAIAVLLLGGGTATALPAEDRVVPAPPDAGDLLAGFASGLALVRVHEAREKELRGAMVRAGRRDPVIARQLRAEVAAERTLLVAASARVAAVKADLLARAEAHRADGRPDLADGLLAQLDRLEHPEAASGAAFALRKRRERRPVPAAMPEAPAPAVTPGIPDDPMVTGLLARIARLERVVSPVPARRGRLVVGPDGPQARAADVTPADQRRARAELILLRRQADRLRLDEHRTAAIEAGDPDRTRAVEQLIDVTEQRFRLEEDRDWAARLARLAPVRNTEKAAVLASEALGLARRATEVAPESARLTAQLGIPWSASRPHRRSSSPNGRSRPCPTEPGAGCLSLGSVA
jgi:hypothetical protein